MVRIDKSSLIADNRFLAVTGKVLWSPAYLLHRLVSIHIYHYCFPRSSGERNSRAWRVYVRFKGIALKGADLLIA